MTKKSQKYEQTRNNTNQKAIQRYCVYPTPTIVSCVLTMDTHIPKQNETKQQDFYQASSSFRPGGSDNGLLLDSFEEALTPKATAKGTLAATGGTMSLTCCL
jgi:hypothetical protein